MRSVRKVIQSIQSLTQSLIFCLTDILEYALCYRILLNLYFLTMKLARISYG